MVIVMSLRHGLLAMLSEEPASGYDLMRRFQEVLGAIWPARHPQIYPELGRLEREGLIEVESEGSRRRKSYAITEAGLAEVQRWLAEVDIDHSLRLQPLLRSVFIWLLPPDAIHRHLEREASSYRDLAARYRLMAAAVDRSEDPASLHHRSTRAALEAVIRLYSALAEWADWTQQTMASRPDGQTPEGHQTARENDR